MANLFTSKIILLFTSIIIFSFLILTSIGYKNNIYTSNFVDEEDNFTVARYVLQGEKIYTDIFSHHQPIPYFISAGIQTLKGVDNINQLIKWHRYFMIFWGVVWCLILFYKFRFFAVPFIAIYELTKIFLIGHTFLAEAFVVYPLVYLLLSILVNKNIRALEIFFIGILSAFIVFTLSPMWPVVIFLLGVIFLKMKERKLTHAVSFLIGFLSITIIIFSLISFKDYFYNTIYLNLIYYIPMTTPNDQLAVFKAFLSPIAFSLSRESAIYIKSISLVFLSLITYSIFKHSKKTALIIFLVLGLANIRYSTGSFHLLPWYGLLICGVSYLCVKDLINKNINIVWKSIVGLMILSFIAFNLYLTRDRLFKKIDTKLEAYIHYSQQYDYGKAVDIMREDGDSLMVVPVDPLILWQANVKHATKYLFYYTWMANVPQIRAEVIMAFENNPPTYFYFDKNTKGTGLEKYLYEYQNITRNNGKTNLYILKGKVKRLNEDQLKKLQFFNFSV